MGHQLWQKVYAWPHAWGSTKTQSKSQQKTSTRSSWSDARSTCESGTWWKFKHVSWTRAERTMVHDMHNSEQADVPNNTSSLSAAPSSNSTPYMRHTSSSSKTAKFPWHRKHDVASLSRTPAKSTTSVSTESTNVSSPRTAPRPVPGLWDKFHKCWQWPLDVLCDTRQCKIIWACLCSIRSMIEGDSFCA